jgi:hypothetical protein
MIKVFAGMVRKAGFFQKAGFPGNSERIFGIYHISETKPRSAGRSGEFSYFVVPEKGHLSWYQGRGSLPKQAGRTVTAVAPSHRRPSGSPYFVNRCKAAD